MELGTSFPEHFHVIKVASDVVVGCHQMTRLEALFEVKTANNCSEDVRAVEC